MLLLKVMGCYCVLSKLSSGNCFNTYLSLLEQNPSSKRLEFLGKNADLPMLINK